MGAGGGEGLVPIRYLLDYTLIVDAVAWRPSGADPRTQCSRRSSAPTSSSAVATNAAEELQKLGARA